MPRIFEATATVLQSGICIGIDIISCIHCKASTEVSFQEADANNHGELCCTNQHTKGSQLYSSHKFSARNAPTDVEAEIGWHTRNDVTPRLRGGQDTAAKSKGWWLPKETSGDMSFDAGIWVTGMKIPLCPNHMPLNHSKSLLLKSCWNIAGETTGLKLD